MPSSGNQKHDAYGKSILRAATGEGLFKAFSIRDKRQ